MAEKMTFTDALFQEREAFRKGPLCRVCAAVEDDPAVAEALSRPEIFGTAIARALQKVGYDVSAHTVQRHRREHMETEK